jgi:hypothetical protein
MRFAKIVTRHANIVTRHAKIVTLKSSSGSDLEVETSLGAPHGQYSSGCCSKSNETFYVRDLHLEAISVCTFSLDFLSRRLPIMEPNALTVLLTGSVIAKST